MDGNGNLFGVRGFLIDAPDFGTLRGWRNGALIIENGRILEAGDYDDLRRLPQARSFTWIDRGTAVISPGLIDCHTPLPQYSAENDCRPSMDPVNRPRLRQP